MSEATDILRSYVRLVERLSGAASVSLYVPPGPGGESEILLHDGRFEPVPELADAATAAELHQRFINEHGDNEEGAVRLPSSSPDGVLYRIPLRWVFAKAEEDVGGPERRKRDGRPRTELTAWTGLRFDRDASARRQDGLLYFPTAADTLSDEAWWKNFLGLAAAFAAHARTVSRTLFDQVTGLPERPEFQAELESALAQAEESKVSTVLVLLGPDDFGWVNERLDRRSGDLVLREIATGLRASLRSHDHVARYGGAIFTVILVDTDRDVGRMVAENVVRRLSEHRYHGGILRLDFSAGLAVADAAEPVGALEMIRRGDQALSAAKRDDAGVRVWEKGSDVETAGSLDRLQGIFTGDKVKDYRNMRLLLDTMTVVAASNDSAELARNFTERLFDTLHARRVGVLEASRGGSFELLGGLERTEGTPRAFTVMPRDLAILERACRERNFVAENSGPPDDLSLCALPLCLQDRCLGGIVLEVTSVNVAFEGSDRQFLDALASEMAVALDRAHLLGRERERQKEEKERLEAEVTDLRLVLHGSRLAYRSAAMESLLATARKVARTDTTVLITGESGTGKEMVAHTLHELSGRRDKPVVVVDCGAIAPTLIESELFGHEKGAFTGAHTRKPGRLAQAEGATVFLDEIGELPLDLQSKLLRFVQEKEFTPVGSVVARTVDVRIIAATNVDLRAKVAEGKFREDLFHRLNVVRLHVAPLRERKDDILHLATIFLQQFAALYRRPAHHFTPRAEQALEAYPWPGNVRELQNLIMTSVLFCDAAEVDVPDLHGFQAAVRPGGPEPQPASSGAPAAEVSAAPGPAATPSAGDPVVNLRQALAREIASAVAGGRGNLVPLGKWLAEDLVLAADRLAAGVSRRGAELLGLADSTYRRQLQGAAARRAAGLAVRSPTWSDVAALLEDFIRARRGDTDVCQWAEAGLLAEIESAVPGEPRTAAALLGVTEPTLLRRRAELSRHF
jgi:diguanylate cyclase (GGDEF)-like protein